MSSTSFLEQRAYSNTNHDNDSTNYKFITGLCIFLSYSLIYQKNKKQSIVSQFSTEAEYRVITSTTKEIVWLCWLLADMKVFISHLTPMYCEFYSDCSQLGFS